MPPNDSIFSRTPMFGGDPGYSTSGVFNFDMGMGPLPQIAMQLMAAPYMHNLSRRHGMMPLQFMPMQGAYDQYLAQQHLLQQQQAAQIAATADTRQIEQTILGGMRLMTGQANTLREQQQAFGAARHLSGMLPIVGAVLGEDVVDQLHGRRGSATMLANAMFRAMRRDFDPVTGGLGATGDTSGFVSQQVFENLYGSRSNLASMRGIGAGAAGRLYEELQMRGYGDLQTNMSPLRERAAAAASITLSDSELADMAERTDRIRKLRTAGSAITDADFAAARSDVAATHTRLRERMATPGAVISEADFAGPGGDDILRIGDARRISDRLKNMSGAVAAMREIFGDMGRPNAPMREIINGLDALTQGGLATMSPSRVEEMVRMTHAMAKQTGMGMQAAFGMAGQVADIADRVGVERTLVPGITQSAGFFGAAAGSSGRLGGFGGFTKEEATLLDAQLRTTAARSTTSNVLGVAVRMFQEGLLDPESEGGRLAQDVMAGKATAMSSGDLVAIMARSGVSEVTTRAMLQSKAATQEYIRNFNIADSVRAKQYDIDVQPMLKNVFVGQIAGVGAKDVADKLRDAGIIGADRGAFSTFANDVAGRIPGLLRDLTPEQLRSNTAMRDAITERVKQAYSDAAAARVRAGGKRAGETDAEFESRIATAASDAVNALGEHGARDTAAGLIAAGDIEMGRRGFKGMRGMLQMNDPEIMRAAAARRAEAASHVAIASAMSGVGAVGPVGRLADALREAAPGDDITKILLKFGGAVEGVGDEGPIKAMLDTLSEVSRAERDETGRITPAGLARSLRLATTVRGLVEGGIAADHAMSAMAKEHLGRSGTPEELETVLRGKIATAASDTDRKKYESELLRVQALRESRKGGGVADIMARRGYSTDKHAVSAETLNSLGTRGNRAHELVRTGKAGESASLFEDTLATSQASLERIIGSTSDMTQLGAGALDKLAQIEVAQRTINAMAAEAGVTSAQLLSGNVDKKYSAHVAKAREAHNKLLKGWATIYDIKAGGKMPGADGRIEMSAAEAREAAAYADFLAGRKYVDKDPSITSLDDIRKAVRSGQVSDTASEVLRATGLDEGHRTEIEGLVGKGDRRHAVYRALRSREELLRLAASKGLLKHGGASLTASRIGEATPAEQEAAINALHGASLSATEQSEWDRLMKRYGALRGLEGDNINNARERLEKITTAPDADTTTHTGSRGGHGKREMTMTGELTLKDPNKVLLSGVTYMDIETDGIS